MFNLFIGSSTRCIWPLSELIIKWPIYISIFFPQYCRCKECCSTLLPGSYRPGSETGTFVCTHHHRPRTGTSSPESVDENSMQNAVQSPPKPRAPPKPPLPNKPQKELDTDGAPYTRPVPAPRKTSDVVPQPLPRARSGAGQSPARPTSFVNGKIIKWCLEGPCCKKPV